MIKWCLLPLGGEKKCRDELISHIDFLKSELILDMCCGTGGATSSILRRVSQDCQLIGIDLSSGQLRQASKRQDVKNVQFIEGDVSTSCFRDNAFDKVFITHALHEMKRDSRLKVLHEAKRIIKKNGSLIILELNKPIGFLSRLFYGFWFFYWFPFNPETPTRKEMLKYGIENEIREVGFREINKTLKFQGVLQTVQGTK